MAKRELNNARVRGAVSADKAQEAEGEAARLRAMAEAAEGRAGAAEGAVEGLRGELEKAKGEVRGGGWVDEG